MRVAPFDFNFQKDVAGILQVDQINLKAYH